MKNMEQLIEIMKSVIFYNMNLEVALKELEKLAKYSKSRQVRRLAKLYIEDIKGIIEINEFENNNTEYDALRMYDYI